MSYCRFSSDDWKSDVYCYEDCSGGWTTHVAGTRIVEELPKMPSWGDVTAVEWCRAHKIQREALDSVEYENIGLEHDGASFNDPDLESFKDTLTMLKESGYHVPEYVFDVIEEEMKDDA